MTRSDRPTAVRVTPRGTRGAKIPKFSGPLKAVFLALNVGIFRLFGRRMRVMGRPLLLLTTVGARSGSVRRATLGWFPDDDRSDSWLVVASYAGAVEHPAWFINLARNPRAARVEVGGRTLAVRAETLEGNEYARAWRRVVELAPGYGAYQTKTDRRIPVVRLSALGASSQL